MKATSPVRIKSDAAIMKPTDETLLNPVPFTELSVSPTRLGTKLTQMIKTTNNTNRLTQTFIFILRKGLFCLDDGKYP